MSSRPVRYAALSLAVLFAFSACSSDSGTEPRVDEIAVLAFDGADDYVEVPAAAALDLTGNLTLAAWFFFTGGFTGEAGLIQKDGDGSFGRYGLWVLGDEVDFCVYIAGGSQHCMYAQEGLTMNAWNHVAGVYDGAEMRLYINGELDSSQNVSGAISTSSGSLFIGADPTESRYLAGRLHDVQLWSVARTGAQIAAAMTTPPTGAEAGLVGYWPFDDGSGQVAGDATGNGLAATLGASAAADASDPAWATTAWPN